MGDMENYRKDFVRSCLVVWKSENTLPGKGVPVVYTILPESEQECKRLPLQGYVWLCLFIHSYHPQVLQKRNVLNVQPVQDIRFSIFFARRVARYYFVGVLLGDRNLL
jgi:hypothetical protein